MNIHLVVVQAFCPHAKGDHITDPTDVASVLASDHAGHVVRIETADAPTAFVPPQEA